MKDQPIIINVSVYGNNNSVTNDVNNKALLCKVEELRAEMEELRYALQEIKQIIENKKQA